MVSVLELIRVTPMKALFKPCFVVIIAVLMAPLFVSIVNATSIVNVAGLDTPQPLVILSPPMQDDIWFTQSFTTMGDGLNLTSIALPLTMYNNTVPGGPYPPGIVTVQIRAQTTYGMLNPSLFPIVSQTANLTGTAIPVSIDPTDIYWVNIPVTPTMLAPSTTYVLAVNEAWSSYNGTGFFWWANGHYGSLGNTNYAYEYYAAILTFTPMPYTNVTATGNNYAFGFELVESHAAYIGVDVNAQLFLSLFLCLGMGLIGFAMTKGTEPLAAIFMVEFGVFISYLIGWCPVWILAASIAVLGIVLAYKFRGAISHG